MKSQLSLPQKALLLVALPLAGQLVFLGVLGYLLKEVEVQAQKAERSRAVISQTTSIIWLTYDACTSLVAYNMAKSDLFKHSFQRRADQIGNEVEVLQRLTEDSPEQFQSAEKIRALTDKGLVWMHKMAADTASNPLSVLSLSQHRDELERLVQEIAGESEKLANTERAASKSSPVQESKARSMVEIALISGILLNIVAAIGFTTVFNKSVSTRLASLIENSLRLARGQRMTEPMGGSDEISQLDQTFRFMASELEEANKKQRAIIENASDVICSIDGMHEFTQLNPACIDVLGYEPQELIGKKFTDIVFSEDVERTRQTFANLIEAKTPGFSFENRVTRKDGTLIDILWSFRWSETERAMFCVAHDVSARKEVERFKQEFLEMVSHDVRTPLTSVGNTLQLLELGVRRDNWENDLSIARRNLGQVVDLLNELLDVQRMEEGKLELIREQTSAQELFAGAIEVVSAYAEGQSVQLVGVPDDVVVYCDGHRMHQVLINLLSNAVKFSPPGGKVSAFAEAAEDGWVMLKVIDEGLGVPPEFRQAIFERFKQVRASDDRKKGGKGLGLAICKGVVEQHGGEIGVDSNGERGSVFWIKLPPEVPVVEPVSSHHS